MLVPFSSSRAGTSPPSSSSACSGDTRRSRFGTRSARAPARIRTGCTSRGVGCRAASIARCPIQRTGRKAPAGVRTRSPGRSVSTAASPSPVAIRVPAATHKACATIVLPLTSANWPAEIPAPKIILSIPPAPAPAPLSATVSVVPLTTLRPDSVPPEITNLSPAWNAVTVPANPAIAFSCNTPVAPSNTTSTTLLLTV